MGDNQLCPRCQLVLDAVDDKGTPFLGCQKCYGLWVTEPDLLEYVEKSVTPRVYGAYVELYQKMLESQQPGSMRHCPHCRAKLSRVKFGENPLVLLDRCEEHGIWLDRTELNKVIRSARFAAGHRADSQDNEPDEEVGPLKGLPPEPPALP